MTKHISFTNFKGGVGKTSTAINLSKVFGREKNKKVLIIDLDQQGNSTKTLLEEQVSKDSDFLYNVKNAEELFKEGDIQNVKDAIVNVTKNIDLIPAKLFDLGPYLFENDSDDFRNELKKEQDSFSEICSKDNLISNDKIRLNSIHTKIEDFIKRGESWSKVLKKKISEIEGEYDYIFYDLPPSSSKIIQNAWIASDYLMIPVSDTFSLEGTDLLLNTMINIKKEHNPDLKFIFFLNKVKLHSNKTGEHLGKHHYKIMTLLSDALDSNEDLSSMAYMMNSGIRYSMSVETGILDENIRGDYKSVANELDKLIKNN